VIHAVKKFLYGCGMAKEDDSIASSITLPQIHLRESCWRLLASKNSIPSLLHDVEGSCKGTLNSLGALLLITYSSVLLIPRFFQRVKVHIP
jgi:hypothetical protein